MGQTDLARLLMDAEKTAGIDEQAVRYWLFLKGHRWSDYETGRKERERV